MDPRSMRTVEELRTIHESGEGELSLEEARLLDLKLFEETGEHLNEFKPVIAEAPIADFVVRAIKRDESLEPSNLVIPDVERKIPVSKAKTLPDALPNAIPSRGGPEPSKSLS